MASAPKKLRLLGTNEDEEDDRVLSNLGLFLHPASLGKARLAILRKSIERKGGRVVQDESNADVVLVDAELVPPAKLKVIVQKLLLQKSSRNCRILALKWLTNAVEGKECDEDDFDLSRKFEKKDDKFNDFNANSVSIQATGSMSSIFSTNVESKGDFVASSPKKKLQEGFVCAHASSSSSSLLSSPNKHLTAPLERLASAYASSNDPWRAFGYRKAIAALKRCPYRITSGAQAAELAGVGAKMAAKVAEIIDDNALAQEREMCSDQRIQTLNLFNRVWGAGPVTADHWYAMGCRSLDDVKSKAGNQLTKHQVIGLELFEDLDERMNREEAKNILKVVEKEAEKLAKGVEVIGCGSYRRGKPTCGDLDVLITHENEISLDGLFDALVSNLRKSGFLTHDLTIHKDGRQSKYLGVCRLDQAAKHRRLDIIVVPPDEKATALLYFTGSAHFNRSMRLLATKMGMSLSEHALTSNVVRNGREKLNQGNIIPSTTEEDVFKHLGLEYRPPSERDY